MNKFQAGDKIKYRGSSIEKRDDTIYVVAKQYDTGEIEIEGFDHNKNYNSDNFYLVERNPDPEIDIQWISEKQLFIIDGVEITVEALKQLVHSSNNYYKEPQENKIDVDDLETFTRNLIDWQKWVKVKK